MTNMTNNMTNEVISKIRTVKETTNSIEIRGRISSELTFSHEIHGEGFYRFTIETERLSEYVDLLPVTISGRLCYGLNLVPGNYVNIYGQVRSYNSYLKEEQRNRLHITVYAFVVELLDYVLSPLMQANNVLLDGFICKNPIFRVTPFGREIADILLAVNRPNNKSDYIPCVCWGRNARFASMLDVSTRIRIGGRFQSRAYQKKYDDGSVVEKSAYEISVSRIELRALLADERTG